jgi:hypothetical protein
MDPHDKRRILRTAIAGMASGALCGLGIGTGALAPFAGIAIAVGLAVVFGSMILRQRSSALARQRRRP